MKALIKHTKSLNRVLCCVLSFTLAFYTLCTPAFAEELVEVAKAPMQTEEAISVEGAEPTDSSAIVEDEDSSEIVTAAEEPEAITVAEENTGEEIDPDFVAPKASHSVSSEATYDISTCTVNFSVTVKNESKDTAISGLHFYFLNAAESVMNEDNGEFEGYEPFELDHPADFDLAAGEAKTFTFAHELILRPQTGQKVNVELFASVVTLSGEDVDLAAEGSTSITCAIPYVSYDVDAYAMAIDEYNNIRGEEDLLLPGDTVFFFYNVLNNGSLPLDVSAVLEEGSVMATNAADEWNTNIVLQPNEYCSFIACIDIDESMVGTTVGATANLNIGDDEKKCDLESNEVADSFYQYVIYFGVRDADGGGEILPKAQINMKQAAAEFYWPFDSIKANCPDIDAYTPTYYDANHNPIDLDSVEYLTLSDDPSQNEFYVVYEPIVEQAEYTVYYYMDSVAGTVISSETRTGKIGAEIPLDLSGNCPEGYQAEAIVTGPSVIGSDSAQNVVEVVYAKDYFGYTINYYTKDHEGNIAFKTSISGEKAVFGSTVTLTDAQLNAELDQGYTAIAESPDYSLLITADASANSIDVIYEPAAYSYIIHYYKKDHAGEVTYLGSAMTGEEALFGSTVEPTGEQLNAKRPTGFKEVAPGPENQLKISADKNENAITVTYEPDTFTYTIRYYKDNAIDDSVHILGDAVEGEGLYGSTVHIDRDTLNLRAPGEGFHLKDDSDEFDIVISDNDADNSYSVVYERKNYGYTIAYYRDSADNPANLIDTRQGVYAYDYERYLTPGEINACVPDGYKSIFDTKYVHITADESKNVLNIVYDKKRTDFAYTVNYYKDDVSGENLLGSDAGTGMLNAEIPYENGKFVPEGYDPNGVVRGTLTIGLDEDENVLNVVYVKGNFDYVVKYYKDEVDDANFLGQKTGSAVLGSEIPYEVGPFVPEGYVLSNAATSGTPIVTAHPESNVLSVIYTTKQDNLSWRVNYYYGDNTAAPFESRTGYGSYGDAIPYDLEAYLPLGYTMPAKVTGDTNIVNLEGESVLNVVYPLGTYEYVINYYKDEVSANNLLGSEVSSGLYLSPISFIQGKYAPEGYKSLGLTSGARYVGYDSANNVLNVVYTIESYAYTVNYYVGFVSEGNLIASVSDPEDIRPYGSTVELRIAQMNAYRPNGYSELTNARNLTISANEQANVVNVVFTPDFGEFYMAGVDPVDVTYDGEKHYLTARGVQEGDVVTYMYNGAYETRSVGVDDNIGVEFQDVTDGSIPVAVTITRAGITSNAVQTLVNIVPQPTPVVPDDPAGPQTPQNPSDPEDQTQPDNPIVDDREEPIVILPSNSNPLAQLFERIVSFIDPGIEVPMSEAAELDPAMDGAIDDESIVDDPNPLAANPDGSQNIISALSLVIAVLATISLAASALFFLIRLRLVNRLTRSGFSAAALGQLRVSTCTRLAVTLAVTAALLYAVWLLLLL